MAIMELVEIGEVIGRNVAKLMSERGWTQGQLASRSGLSQPQVSELVNGKTDEPKLSKLLGVASALGVSIERLYEGWAGPTPAVSETEAQRLEARLGRLEKNVSDLRRDLKQPPYEAEDVENRAIETLVEFERASERSSTEESEIGGAQ